MRRQKRDFGKINPRFKAPSANGHRINFTKRTLDRLFASWRFGLLDETHISKLLGSYGRHTHRELELTKSGLIYHPEAQIPLRAVCTNISWVTALSNKGADILASKGFRLDPTKHRERYRRHKSYNAMLHDLNRSDFLIEIDWAIRMLSERQQRLKLDCANTLQIRHQDEIFGAPYTEAISFPSVAVWKREHRPLTIEPDGIFSLILPNLPKERAEKFFAIEIDQDTESNMRYRNFWEQKSVIKTMISYAEAHKRGIIEEKLGVANLRTIFVTTTERHLNNIIKDAALHYIAQGYPANLILFVSRERLEKFDPNSVEYKNAAGKSVLISELY